MEYLLTDALALLQEYRDSPLRDDEQREVVLEALDKLSAYIQTIKVQKRIDEALGL